MEKKNIWKEILMKTNFKNYILFQRLTSTPSTVIIQKNYFNSLEQKNVINNFIKNFTLIFLLMNLQKKFKVYISNFQLTFLHRPVIIKPLLVMITKDNSKRI